LLLQQSRTFVYTYMNIHVLLLLQSYNGFGSPSSFLVNFETTATKTGARLHHSTLLSLMKEWNFSKSACSLANTKCHGCQFAADGAQRAASKILCNFSSSTFLVEKAREDQRSK